MGKITEFEGAVLGTVWREGPLTSYAVLSMFEASLTRSWTASTGSVYPAIRRLVSRGLIEATERVGDGRATRELSITKAGLAMLREWIRDLVAATGPPSDPLRVRMQFLGALDSRSQRRWANEASHRLSAQLQPIDDELARIDAGSEGDPNGPRAAWVRRAVRWVGHATVLRRTMVAELGEELGSKEAKPEQSQDSHR